MINYCLPDAEILVEFGIVEVKNFSRVKSWPLVLSEVPKKKIYIAGHSFYLIFPWGFIGDLSQLSIIL